MIDWTYTYFRQFMRILSCDALLYTEMVTTGAIKNQPEKHLYYRPEEHPIALQIGGSEWKVLAQCASKAELRGYDEINLNVGCPSDRVQSGRFGACLMAEPKRVADAISAMKQNVSIPVTVKTRIGIDHHDNYEFFLDFISNQIEAGVDKLVIHARKAWLNGLSPKQNRNIPPINYEFVYQLKRDFPDIPIVINGDIKSIDAIHCHLQQVDGIMIGRLACDNPYAVHLMALSLFSKQQRLSRAEAFGLYIPVIESGFHQSIPLSILTKPIINLCYGLPGSKQWKKQVLDMVQTKSIDDLVILEKMIMQLESQYNGKMFQSLVH